MWLHSEASLKKIEIWSEVNKRQKNPARTESTVESTWKFYVAQSDS